MIVRLEPISAIVLSVLLGWGWHQLTNEPICQVEEVHDGKTILVPKYCSEVLTN